MKNRKKQCIWQCEEMLEKGAEKGILSEITDKSGILSRQEKPKT
ncbi:MAG: hypothetical protein ACLU3F_13765 [Blautia wexlerae]